MTPQPFVRSVNIGDAAPGRKGRPSGIGKRATDAIEVRDPGPKHGGLGSGVIGDFIGSRRHHGGSDQAVYAVAREELDWWGRELGRELPDGMFGENLTTVGLDVDAALIGEVWAIGTAELTVAGPRIPCDTFAFRMGERGWVKRFAARGRSGAYLAVSRPGMITAGDPITVLSRPEHDVTVPTTMAAWFGDVEALDQVLASGAGSPAFREEFATRRP